MKESKSTVTELCSACDTLVGIDGSIMSPFRGLATAGIGTQRPINGRIIAGR